MAKPESQSLWQGIKDIFAPSHEAKSGDELEFLPASLEMVETPPSPIGRAILWCIVAVVVLGVIWASVFKTDVVAVTQGKIIPSGNVKTIQPLEYGVIKEILVKDGQVVKKGELIIVLDSTASKADVDRLSGELLDAALEGARLRALLSWSPNSGAKPVFNPPREAPKALVDRVRRHLEQESSAFAAKLKTIDSEIARLTARMNSSRHTVDKLSAMLPIITKRAEARKKLYKSGMGPENEWLVIEEQRIEIAKDLKTEAALLDEAKAAITVERERRKEILSEYRRDLMDKLSSINTRIKSGSQELKKATNRNTQQRILAPVSGRVQQLAVHTIGGIVQPAQPLMVIVPENASLVAEVKVLNKDIGFVHAGQAVEVKLEAFPFTEYGIIDGKLVHVSGDAIQDDKGDLFYTARVKLDQTYILVNGKKVRLTSGMRLSAEVKIRKRRIISYFLSPLLKYLDESVKER